MLSSDAGHAALLFGTGSGIQCTVYYSMCEFNKFSWPVAHLESVCIMIVILSSSVP